MTLRNDRRTAGARRSILLALLAVVPLLTMGATGPDNIIHNAWYHSAHYQSGYTRYTITAISQTSNTYQGKTLYISLVVTAGGRDISAYGTVSANCLKGGMGSRAVLDFDPGELNFLRGTLNGRVHVEWDRSGDWTINRRRYDDTTSNGNRFIRHQTEKFAQASVFGNIGEFDLPDAIGGFVGFYQKIHHP